MQAEANTPECSQIQQIVTQFKQALDHGCVISLARDGQVQLMTEQAKHLLRQYALPHDPQALPDPLQHWFKYQISQLTFNGDRPSPCLPLHIEQAERQLIIRLIPDLPTEQYLLLLEEQELPSFSIAALELLGLTKREAEVLFWIAKDKSNAGIARVLGCCEGTVRKHLEKLYKKLGVQTRMGAVMVALEKLGILKESFVAKSS
ncbi:MAG: helix-turn-helix transcriptional regulator [Moorea sp. SIO1G6]|nr:helix-turn-helix transcriptional regulator [Moorena sp. SIO1G6]